MEREEFLHFDSLNAIKSTDVFNATFNLQKTYTKIKNIGHKTDFFWNLILVGFGPEQSEKSDLF